MALDLSALDDDTPPASAEPTGKPLEIPLALIDEDPDQPRQEFTEEAMQEMEDSIRARGVKSPVSVRPNPAVPGRWLLNFGARRFRGSARAGKLTIPAFVDESHDNYDQVIENIQRDELKPMELALFIQKRMNLGEKKGEIAKRLNKDSSFITNHLALVEAPPCIEDAYTTGKCTSAKTLYELRGLHDKFPEQVTEWCGNADVIDRRSVAELADVLKGNRKPAAPEVPAGSNEPGAGNDPAPAANAGADGAKGNAPDDATKKGEKKGAGKAKGDGDGAGGDGDGQDLGELTSWPRGKAVSDPDLMKKPLLLVEYDGRSAAVLLNRKPSAAGLLRIRYEDGGGDAEVDAGLCKINLLTEASQ